MAKTVTGVVVDTDQEPIVGASVLVKGTTVGASTNIDGEFTLNAPESAKTLVVSYVGMATQEVAITSGKIKVVMKSVTTDLDEVVVVAYGSQKKSSITGSISQVKADDIEKRPVSSVASALEGTTSGVTVTAAYGQPGESPSVRIRGIGTVTGSASPLYVIDGVPFGGNISDINPDDIASMSVLKDAASAALYGSRASNGVILITTKKANKERVSFTFKTTQGWYERGVPEYNRANAVEFMQAEFRNVAYDYIKNGNTPENIAKAAAEANKSLISERLYTNVWDCKNNELFDEFGNLTTTRMRGTYAEDLDWWDQTTRRGYRGEYSFSGSGATEKSDFYFSLGYLDEDGFMPKSGFERFSGRAVVNVKPVNWFKAGLNLNATHQKQHNSKGNGDDNTSYVNPVYYARYMSPIYPVHQHDPETGDYILDKAGNLVFDTGEIDNEELGLYGHTTRMQNQNRHAILENQLNSSATIRNTINGISYADFILPYGLTFTLKGNLNVRNSEATEYGSAIIGDAVNQGRLKKTIYNYKNWTFQQQLRWNYNFGGIHVFEVLLGHENYADHYDRTYVYKTDEKFAGVAALSNFSTVNSTQGYRDSYRTESYLARVQYNYDERYNIEASWRTDGSSRFHKDHRWGHFGSVGANWVFTNEDFMKDVTWLTNGKIRADWGQVANDQGSGLYAYRTLYGSSSGGTNAGQPAYWFEQFANELLQWETGQSWGVALEGRLFNRWNISLEYYSRTNKDLLFDVRNPLSAGPNYPKAGDSSITQNFGELTNSGIEINTDVDIVKTKDWTFNFGMNLTTLRNRMDKMPAQMKKSGYAQGSQLVMEGRNIYSWYTYHYEGVDQMTGRALYTPDLYNYHVFVNGEQIGGHETEDSKSTPIPEDQYIVYNGQIYTLKTTYGKKQFCGKALPSVYGAFTPSVRYKNFNLSALITWSLGGKVLDYNYQDLMSLSTAARAVHKDILNSWFGAPEGMTADSPDRITKAINPAITQTFSSENNAVSDRFLTSRDYLVIKNISASYSLPKAWVKKLQLQNVLLTFSGENLFTKTARKGLNAQQSTSGYQYNYLPASRVYTFGLTVNL